MIIVIKIRYSDPSGLVLISAETTTEYMLNIQERLNSASFTERRFFEFLTVKGSVILPIASIVSIDIIESDSDERIEGLRES